MQHEVREHARAPEQPAAMAWLNALWRTREGRLSVQVLQEYYVTVTAKLDPDLTSREARDDVRRFATWDPLAIDASLLEEAGRDLDGFVVIDPFASEPGETLEGREAPG